MNDPAHPATDNTELFTKADPDGIRALADVVPIPLRLRLDPGVIAADLDIVGIPGFVGMLAMPPERDLTPTHAVRTCPSIRTPVGEIRHRDR